ncbi:MAG: hypothetical protein ACPGVB_10675 [Chitinophagales bacterium]
MKAITIVIILAIIFLQSPNTFAQSQTDNSLVPNTNLIPAPVSVPPAFGHLITFTADYGTNAISIFYPNRTELIYMKVRKTRWIGPYKTYSMVDYAVTYEDGTRKHFENVKLFRGRDAMQRVVTDYLSKITELGYELVESNMTDFEGRKYLTAIFRFKE